MPSISACRVKRNVKPGSASLVLGHFPGARSWRSFPNACLTLTSSPAFRPGKMLSFCLARLATCDPVSPGIGYGMDVYFTCLIVDGKGNDSLAARRNGSQPQGDLVTTATLVRQIGQTCDGCVDLVQATRRGMRTRIVNQPLRDGFEILRDCRMEPDAITQPSCTACRRARAGAKASSAET